MRFVKNSRIWKVFFHAPGARPLSVTLCILVAGIFDMLSIGAILPAIGSIGGQAVASSSKLNEYFVSLVEFVGLEPNVTTFVVLVAILLSLKSLMALAAMSYVASSVANVQSELRNRLLVRVFSANWRYFVNLPPGHIANSISGQTLHAGEAYYSTAMVVVSTVQAIALMLAATLVSGSMVIITALAAVIISVPLYRLILFARRSGERQWERAGLLGTKVQDAVGNMKAIKSMNAAQSFSMIFRSLVGEMRAAYFALLFARHALSYGQDIMIALTVTTGFYIGTQVIEVTLADMFVLGIIYYQVITLVKKVQEHLQQAEIMQAAYFALNDMIDQVTAAQEINHGSVEPHPTNSCRFVDVHFGYEERPILTALNLEIPAKGITVLFGPSGAGKTTIIDLLTGLLRPQAGQIFVDDDDLSEIDVFKWRNIIGYVPQELTLLYGSVYSNVTLGDETISRQDVLDALYSAGASSFIDLLPNGIDTDVGNMGTKLSGGQRQRLSLARALVRKPEILILDEVTSALDAATEEEICNNITRLEGRYTIIAITHRPAWITIATQAYHIEHGQAFPVPLPLKAAE